MPSSFLPKTNLTLPEAVRISPVLDYARCLDASGRPADYAGDWPEEGRVYVVRVLRNAHRGITLVYLLELAATAPYYNAFEPYRFRMVCSTWLN
ncbi:hypothetical protein EJV47_25695 [Hymenobacter gummosus]|uniref:Uncharacterized protein n=1 Tax=Hymenobacter gummosus TaxID=1776032 RepID=A0A431TVR4_9BACT|nr:hypothetical protein [Hymenobacter gummosus]RTQ45275.1 hypothetical protein EJV47_25695 [Hymenobacter gummosus]